MWSGRCVRHGVDGESAHLGWIVDVGHGTNKESTLSVATMTDGVEAPGTPMRLFMRKWSLSYVFCFLMRLLSKFLSSPLSLLVSCHQKNKCTRFPLVCFSHYPF